MEQVKAQLSRMAGLPDPAIDLSRGALLISALHQPGLDVDLHLRRLESLGIAAVSSVPREGDLAARVAALNRFLFDLEGFAGNRDHYYDPRNSYLDQVLERRVGLPITLSLVYVEMARHVGIPAYGIGFPGRFLVGVGDQSGTLVLDAFAGGRILDEPAIDALLAEVFGAGAVTVGAHPSLLRAATNREILVRMLGNLKAVFMREGALDQALIAVDATLVLLPDSADDLRDRGLIYRELGHVPAAIEDLRRYTEIADDGESIAAVTSVLAELAQRSTRLH